MMRGSIALVTASLSAAALGANLFGQAPAPAASVSAVLRDQFARRLQATADEADGVVGYTIIDVTSGERFAHLESTTFPTASTIKLAILYELFKQADQGRVHLDEPRPLDRSHAVPGGLLFDLTTPALSPRDLAVAMVLQSDNTATNVLIDQLGMDAINRRIAGLGLAATHLRRHMIDLEAARRGDENTSTPSDLARLVLVFHEGEGLTPESARAAMVILKKPKHTAITTGVPPEIEIASKPGELEGVRADAGIVYVPGRPYVFVAMGTYLIDRPGATDVVARPLMDLARLSYDYFSRRSTVSDVGRQIR